MRKLTKTVYFYYENDHTGWDVEATVIDGEMMECNITDISDLTYRCIKNKAEAIAEQEISDAAEEEAEHKAWLGA